MVFETSCWSGDGFNQNENSVQRRPKLDYFNVDAVKQTPIISHISSNGYYGYCPTTYTNNIVDTSMNGNSTTATATATATSMGNSGDFPMNDTITPMDTMRNDIQTTHIQQQHQGQSIDKRKRTNDQCNMIEIKRSRNCFSDCRIEDEQMHTDDKEMVDALDMNKTVNKANTNSYIQSTMMMSHII